MAFANYYRKHIKNFAEIAAPLNKLGRKHVPFFWSTDWQKAFDYLRQALINPRTLQYSDFSLQNEFRLQKDISKFAIGAVLSNKDNRPVAYASRGLNKAELHPTINKKLLSISGQ